LLDRIIIPSVQSMGRLDLFLLTCVAILIATAVVALFRGSIPFGN
jgi:hypothetical protein